MPEDKKKKKKAGAIDYKNGASRWSFNGLQRTSNGLPGTSGKQEVKGMKDDRWEGIDKDPESAEGFCTFPDPDPWDSHSGARTTGGIEGACFPHLDLLCPVPTILLRAWGAESLHGPPTIMTMERHADWRRIKVFSG